MVNAMTASTARKSLVRATEDGERRWFFGGGLHIWKATADDTDGAFLLFEDRMDHGKVTPLHLHPDSDETMIVLQGEILMHLGGEEHTVQAGGIASAPRGIPHAFKVTGAGGARLLCLHTPGCCQAFYRDASEPVRSDDSRGIDAGPLDMGRVQASAKKNGGIEILGPPPFSQVAQG
jgi:mannose-6-phosphate isomerase-like protein (cupin superfamily)